jgi:hypothetical protein
LGLICTKGASIKVLNDTEVHTQGTRIPDGFKGRKDKRVNKEAFKSTLQNRISPRFLQMQGLHHVSTEALKVFAADHNS